MIEWWRNYRLRKHAREFLRGTRKLIRMNRDIWEERKQAELAAGCGALKQALRQRKPREIQARMQELENRLERLLPPRKHAAAHENVEVLLVAVLVAMGVRTFFVQPFKIPTGSMQPTLYGIFPARDGSRSEPPLPYPNGRIPSLPEKLFGIAVLGRIYEPFGYRTRGDHIFVDKVSYHFRRPRRGEVVVFQTRNIPDLPEPLRGRFYIKRLIGLSGDRIRIRPPYVEVNGQVLDERPAFARIYSQQSGYSGYTIPQVPVPPKYIRSPQDVFEVPADSFFVLGDNSNHSLDGRYWGAFPKRDLVGRAVFVYWPFSRRFGLID